MYLMKPTLIISFTHHTLVLTTIQLTCIQSSKGHIAGIILCARSCLACTWRVHAVMGAIDSPLMFVGVKVNLQSYGISHHLVARSCIHAVSAAVPVLLYSYYRIMILLCTMYESL